ncbi:chromate resistance protein ChrB [Arthrobacter bambusae]|nr:chromate resistance protein ChrB [Arthrobacter bambusae]
MNAEATHAQDASWLVMLVQVPSEPSRHRVAVWRELRRFGGVPVGQGTWTAPDVPVCREGAEKAQHLARAGNGELILLTTSSSDDDAEKLRALFDSAREDEWAEFAADCGKFTDEIAREIAKRRFTLAELEEEEQSLDRLRRWARSIRAKDVFGSPGASGAEERLAACAVALEDFAGRVYQQLHS